MANNGNVFTIFCGLFNAKSSLYIYIYIKGGFGIKYIYIYIYMCVYVCVCVCMCVCVFNSMEFRLQLLGFMEFFYKTIIRQLTNTWFDTNPQFSDLVTTNTVMIYMTIEIYTPLPPYGWVLWRRSNRVAISVHCKPLRIWIEVSAAVERMYVNNSNCDS